MICEDLHYFIRRLWGIAEQFYFCDLALGSLSTGTPDYINNRLSAYERRGSLLETLGHRNTVWFRHEHLCENKACRGANLNSRPLMVRHAPA
jgi:hypothetical protein